MKRLRGVCIGAGYFSPYQCEAWQRIPEVELLAVCDSVPAKAEAIREKFGLPKCYTDYREISTGKSRIS